MPRTPRRSARPCPSRGGAPEPTCSGRPPPGLRGGHRDARQPVGSCSSPLQRDGGPEVLMNRGAFGLVAPSVELNVAVRTISPTDAPIDELATSLVNAEDRAAVGPNLEPKYRICSIAQ